MLNSTPIQQKEKSEKMISQERDFQMRNFLKYLAIYLIVLSGIYLFLANEAFGQVEILYGTYNSEGEVDSAMYKDRYGNTWTIDKTGMLNIQKWNVPLGGWFPNAWQEASNYDTRFVYIDTVNIELNIDTLLYESSNKPRSLESGIIIGFFIGAFFIFLYLCIRDLYLCIRDKGEIEMREALKYIAIYSIVLAGIYFLFVGKIDNMILAIFIAYISGLFTMLFAVYILIFGLGGFNKKKKGD